MSVIRETHRGGQKPRRVELKGITEGRYITYEEIALNLLCEKDRIALTQASECLSLGAQEIDYEKNVQLKMLHDQMMMYSEAVLEIVEKNLSAAKEREVSGHLHPVFNSILQEFSTRDCEDEIEGARR